MPGPSPGMTAERTARSASNCNRAGNVALHVAGLDTTLRVMAKTTQTPATDRATVIYTALWHAIIEQALQPGAKLPEDAIGEKFGASRTIVRAALGRLAA